MKIVHLIWSFNSGGAENMLVDIINQQIENNIVEEEKHEMEDANQLYLKLMKDE